MATSFVEFETNVPHIRVTRKQSDPRSTDPHYGPGPWTTYGLVHGLPYGPLYEPPTK